MNIPEDKALPIFRLRSGKQELTFYLKWNVKVQHLHEFEVTNFLPPFEE